MRMYQPIDPSKPPVRLLIDDYRKKRAHAYAMGQFGNHFVPEFDFEAEAYAKAVQDEATVRAFLHDPPNLG